MEPLSLPRLLAGFLMCQVKNNFHDGQTTSYSTIHKGVIQ
jgi:hypothetical protein